MNLLRFHFLLDSTILLMSPRRLDSVMYLRFCWKISSTFSLHSSLFSPIFLSMSAMIDSKSQISCMMSLWDASNIWRCSLRIQSKMRSLLSRKVIFVSPETARMSSP